MSETANKTSNKFEPKSCSTCNRIYVKEVDFFKETSRWRICSSKHLWFNCKCGSTLMIKNGKYDWYSPDKIMSPASARLFNKLAGLKDLPKISTAIMEIQETLQKPEFEVPIISTKIRKDPILAAKLLETASGLRRLRDSSSSKNFESIEHAIMYVGKKALSELVMTISLQSFSANTKIFNADAHWNDAFVTAELAELISAKWGSGLVKDEVYIAAALCNIGKIVGSIVYADQVDKIEKMIIDTKVPCTWTQSETIFKVPNHMIFGEIGAAVWGLPPYVIDAIGNHHSESNYNVAKEDAKFNLVDCVTLANQLTHWILLRPSRISLNLLNKFSKARGISMKEIEDFAAKCSYLARRK